MVYSHTVIVHLRTVMRFVLSSVVVGLSFVCASSPSSLAAPSSPAGSTVLLRNPGFEKWSDGLPTGWTEYSAPTSLTRSTIARSGAYAAKVATTTKVKAAAGLKDGITPTVTATIKGATYSASCWVRASKEITVKIQIHETKPTGSSVNSAALRALTVPTTTRWYQLKVNYTAQSSGDYLPMAVYSAELVSGGATLLVDDCSLTATGPTPPSTPGNLMVSAPTPNQVNLTWTAANPGSSAITGYRVKRTASSGVQTVFPLVTGISFTDTTGSANTAYTYSVSAVDRNNLSSRPAVGSVTTRTFPPILTASSPAQSAHLTWTATPGATSYNIYRDGSSKIGNTTNNTYDDTTAAPGSHTYNVTAVNLGGESRLSNAVNVLVDSTPPAVTFSLSPSPNSSAWDNGTVTVTFACSDDSGGSGIATCSPPVTLTRPGASQTVVGTATDRAGNTSSVIATVNIDETAPTLGSPTWSANPVAVGTNATVNISVSDDLSGVTGGEYYLGSVDPGQGSGTAMTYANGDLSGQFSNLSPGSYTINIRAQDAAGNWSAVTTTTLVVTDQPPSAPTDLQVYATSPTQIDLAWTASNPGNGAVTDYQVTRSGSDGSMATFNTSGPVIRYQDTGLTTAVTYSYTVAALDKYGVSSGASNSSADTPPAPGTPFNPSQWHTALYAVIHDDVAASTSVTLPNGNILWDFGDATEVNGVSTVSGYGYPHDAFVIQTPGTLNFMAVKGSFGYGWQQVPNWPDGTQFWMSTPIVDGNTLYVLGERVRVSGASSFSILGNYVAEFDAGTLTYEGVVPIPGGATGDTVWGGITQTTVNGAAEWLVTGTHNVPCSYATYCKVGDAALIPFGGIANSGAWQVNDNIIPASDNVGTSLAIVQTSTGWMIYTKAGDAYGGTSIEQLTSSSITGPWSVTGTWSIPSPSASITYGVGVHPEQTSPPGQILVSYEVNGPDDTVYPYEQFLYLPSSYTMMNDRPRDG